MRIFILLRSNENFGDFMLGNKEDPDNFTGESRMRIFILLGSKNSVGKKAYCWRVSSGIWGKKLIPVWKKFRSLGCMPLYWGIILAGDKTKANCYLVNSQTLRQLAGKSGETG